MKEKEISAAKITIKSACLSKNYYFTTFEPTNVLVPATRYKAVRNCGFDGGLFISYLFDGLKRNFLWI